MAMTFSHAVGYRGLASIGGTTILCTGGNINLTQDPIMSGGVWGAGYKNAAPIAYAFNYLSLEGSVNFEWTTGSAAGTSSGVWSTLKSFAIEDRTTKKAVKLLPDGKNGFDGQGWCSSLSFEASEGAALTGSLNFKGDPGDNSITATGEGDESAAGLGTPVASGLVGAVLVPYWKTSVGIGDVEEGSLMATSYEIQTDILNWSCSYNSDLQVLKCCNYQAEAPISADYIVCGEMSGEGSYTIFKISGNFAPTAYHGERGIQFTIDDKTVTIARALVNSGSTSMTTGASYVSCDFAFTALGNGTESILTMS